MIQPTRHLNFIGHEINESLVGYDDHDREIFCKKLHKITVPMKDDCETCPYYDGWMNGYGHQCTWEDQSENGNPELIIPHEDRRKEMLRVSKLIDEGVIKKG